MDVRILLTLLIMLTTAAAAQDDAVEAERELGAVRAKIDELQARVRKASQRRGEAQRALQRAELAETDTRRKLARINEDLAAARERLADLQRRAAKSRAALDEYGAELAQQLRLAFMTGREDWLRVIFNRRDPIDISRQLVYYRYIARQRTALIDVVRRELDALREATRAVDEERARLAGLERDEQARLTELTTARKKRAAALARIDAEISSGSERLATLQRQAESLAELVEELTRLLADLPAGDAVPFIDRRGRMSWPVDGRRIGTFGRPRAGGQMRWDGVLLAAPAGAEVLAVHHGRVVFADWLPGMGLLIVLDHGDGFMSLYGHNQDLLKDVGEWVTPQTTIARVGDSGGRAEPGLYFEIRRDGSPLDPAGWVQQ